MVPSVLFDKVKKGFILVLKIYQVNARYAGVLFPF